MGKKKEKEELKKKILEKLEAVITEVSPDASSKIKKSVNSSAKYLSGKLLKAVKKLEKKKSKEATPAPKKAKAAKKPAAPAKPAAKKAE